MLICYSNCRISRVLVLFSTNHLRQIFSEAFNVLSDLTSRSNWITRCCYNMQDDGRHLEICRCKELVWLANSFFTFLRETIKVHAIILISLPKKSSIPNQPPAVAKCPTAADILVCLCKTPTALIFNLP